MSLQKQHSSRTMTFGEHRDLPKVINTPQEGSGKQRRINVNIDEDVHFRFKSACAKKGTNISNVLKELVDKWMAENE